MTGARHYDGSLRRPAPGSTYEFLLEGMRVFELEDSIDLDAKPFPVPEYAATRDLSAWERVNTAASSYAALIQQGAEALLINAGMPTERLCDPAGRTIVHTLAEAIRAGLRPKGSTPPATRPLSTTHRDGYDKARCQDVILAMSIIHRDLSPNRLALLLNTGAARKAPAVDRDQVRRARKAALDRLFRICAPAAELSGMPVIDLASIYGLQSVNRVKTLLHIHEKARDRPELRGFNGAALVTEIDAQKDFYKVVTRVERLLFPAAA